MVSTIVLENGLADPLLKSTVAKVPRLCVSLYMFHFFGYVKSLPTKMVQKS